MNGDLHLEFLVEEPSMGAFLRAWLPNVLRPGVTYGVYPFRSKTDLLSKLPARLQGYRSWRRSNTRIVVLVDRDRDDCQALKARLDAAARDAGFVTRLSEPQDWGLLNRIVVEELEAWFIGDWEAVRAVYPRVAPNLRARVGYRDSDAISGGTWEKLEGVLQKAGYFGSGLRKQELAHDVGARFDATRCDSRSFRALWTALADVGAVKA